MGRGQGAQKNNRIMERKSEEESDWGSVDERTEVGRQQKKGKGQSGILT
jgi:hypothetical protein